MRSIPIGTLVKGEEDPARAIRVLAPLGFESFSVMFWATTGDADLSGLAAGVREASSATGTVVSSVSVYGNVLSGDEAGRRTLRDLDALIRAAPSFGCRVVSCFAGRIPGSSVPDSIGPWKAVFGPLAELAESLGVCIAFENCRLGDTWKAGKWNISINGDAWELMFAALPSAAIGLEWEPCHQVESLIDPIAQARIWAGRFFHVHGKDARVDRQALAERGLYGARKWHAPCFPGNGDTDWSELFVVLDAAGYDGTVDVEGWNDSEWSGEREIEGQRRALDYLRSCREAPLPPPEQATNQPRRW
jgi:sugar phosphate isomerase/epimerase